jgi:hypothetical protein
LGWQRLASLDGKPEWRIREADSNEAGERSPLGQWGEKLRANLAGLWGEELKAHRAL